MPTSGSRQSHRCQQCCDQTLEFRLRSINLLSQCIIGNEARIGARIYCLSPLLSAVCCSCSKIIEWLGVWRDVVPWQKSLDHKPRPSGVHRRQRAVHFTWVSEGELLLDTASRGRFLASLHCGLDLAALFARLTRRTVEGITDRASFAPGCLPHDWMAVPCLNLLVSILRSSSSGLTLDEGWMQEGSQRDPEYLVAVVSCETSPLLLPITVSSNPRRANHTACAPKRAAHEHVRKKKMVFIYSLTCTSQA